MVSAGAMNRILPADPGGARAEHGAQGGQGWDLYQPAPFSSRADGFLSSTNIPVMTTATATPSKASGSAENFAAMFEESLSRQEMRAGEVITADVVRVDPNFVVVNAGL